MSSLTELPVIPSLPSNPTWFEIKYKIWLVLQNNKSAIFVSEETMGNVEICVKLAVIYSFLAEEKLQIQYYIWLTNNQNPKWSVLINQ